MNKFGLLKITCTSPVVAVGNPQANAAAIRAVLKQVASSDLVVFPELSSPATPAATCLARQTCSRRPTSCWSGPPRPRGWGRRAARGCRAAGRRRQQPVQLRRCSRRQSSGIVPKSFMPNYKEFYEGRWFAAAGAEPQPYASASARAGPVRHRPPFDAATELRRRPSAVEICEDLWVPIPPSSFQALAGATVLRQPVGQQRGRSARPPTAGSSSSASRAAASPPTSTPRAASWESTTDVVFGGHCLIAENGTLLAESPRFQRDETPAVADVDLDRLRVDRLRTNSFGDAQLVPRTGARPFRRGRRSRWPAEPTHRRWSASVDAAPVRAARPGDSCASAARRSSSTQVAGLAKRLEHIGKPPVDHRRLRRPRLDAGPAGRLQDVGRSRRAARPHPGADHARLRHHRPDARQRPGPDAAARRHGRARSTSARCAWRRCGPWATGRSASTWTG